MREVNDNYFSGSSLGIASLHSKTLRSLAQSYVCFVFYLLHRYLECYIIWGDFPSAFASINKRDCKQNPTVHSLISLKAKNNV